MNSISHQFLWPDFKKDELIKAIAEYNRRHRRFWWNIERKCHETTCDLGGDCLTNFTAVSVVRRLIFPSFLLVFLAMIGVAEMLRMKRLEFFLN